jgi:hypothetical protein
MSMPTETSKETPKPDYVTRFFGGPPLSVIFRLVLLSILVGVILEALGFDAVRFLWRYLLLGAVIVVPIWFLLRLARAPRGR